MLSDDSSEPVMQNEFNTLEFAVARKVFLSRPIQAATCWLKIGLDELIDFQQKAADNS